MNKTITTLLVALMLTVCGSVVRAGPFEDATDAYKRNDYASDRWLNILGGGVETT